MPLEDATAAEAHSGQHLLARMADDVAQHDVAAKPLAHLRQQRAHRLVEPEGHFEGFELAPQWLVVRIVPVASVDGIGAEEDGPEAEVPHRPAWLRDGGVDVERRVDVPLPEVGRLDDVDVAVEDAESVVRHDAVLLSMPRTSDTACAA